MINVYIFATKTVYDMLGQPKFIFGDKVSLELQGKELIGIVYIVDPFGTFEFPDDVCYDVLATENGKEILLKHVPENLLTKC